LVRFINSFLLICITTFVEQFHEGRLKPNEFIEYQLEFPPFNSVHEQCQSRYCTTSSIYAALVNLTTVATNDESFLTIVTTAIGLVSSLTATATTTVIILLNDEPSAIAVALRIIIVIV